MLPTVVVGVIWRLMLNPNFGAINGTLQRFGINTESLTWTASPRLAFLSVIAVDVWQWTPFVFLVLLAGLQAIPQEPYEAARIDGSSSWQTFLHITLPLLKPAILIALLLRTMDLLRVFDQIFILTEGGPGFATETVSLYIYRTAFRFFDFGYAAAMSFCADPTNVISTSTLFPANTRGSFMKRPMKRLATYLLILAAVLAIAPVYWLLTISLKSEVDQFASPPAWVSFTPTLEHYIDAFVTRSWSIPHHKRNRRDRIDSFSISSWNCGCLRAGSLELPYRLTKNSPFGFYRHECFQPS